MLPLINNKIVPRLSNRFIFNSVHHDDFCLLLSKSKKETPDSNKSAYVQYVFPIRGYGIKEKYF